MQAKLDVRGLYRSVRPENSLWDGYFLVLFTIEYTSRKWPANIDLRILLSELRILLLHHRFYCDGVNNYFISLANEDGAVPMLSTAQSFRSEMALTTRSTC